MPVQHDTFGACPICGNWHGQVYHLGKDHWKTCDEHQVRWHFGYNLLSGWQFQTEAEQREAFKEIEHYRVVREGAPAELH
jgi:hypothetical protein